MMRNSIHRRLVLAGILNAVGLFFALKVPAHTPQAAAIAAMKRGGTVIFLRHAGTVAEQIDTGRLGDRAGQRNLSPAGIAQARELGRSFAALGIVLDPILASPVFRASDTAEFAFGKDRFQISMDIVADDYAGGNVDAMIAATRRQLRTPPAAGKNRLLVGHRTPFEMVTGRKFPDTILPEGAMAVFNPGNGTLIGTLTSQDLAAAAAAAR